MDNVSQAKAASLFKKEQQAREGEKAWAEYEAQALALRQRTARLRALRLAQPSVADQKPIAGPKPQAKTQAKTQARKKK